MRSSKPAGLRRRRLVAFSSGVATPTRGADREPSRTDGSADWSKPERSRLLGYGSSDQREQPAPTHGPRPLPHFPSMVAFPNREEDDLGSSDDVFERHIADLAEHTAV